MEQQQFRVSFSLGTKLLISVSALLLVLIVAISLSTLFLLQKDKRNYTFQLLGSQSSAVGRELGSTLRRSVDQLRLTLVEIDPRPASGSAAAAGILKRLTENQRELEFISIDKIKREGAPQWQEWLPGADKPKDVSAIDFASAPSAWAELLEKGVTFVSQTDTSGTPRIAVYFADLKLKDYGGGMPVAWGTVSLKSLGAELQNGSFTIATKSGLLLYHSDLLKQFAASEATRMQFLKQDPLFQAAVQNSLQRGSIEFQEGDQKFLGSYTLPGMDLVILSRVPWKKVMQATLALTEKLLFLSVFALGAGMLFSVLFSKRLTAPLTRLFHATRQVASGDFQLRLLQEPKASAGARPSDEIDALTQSFQVMSGKIVQLIQDSMKRVQLENELAIASTVQSNLIPPPQFENTKIRIHSHYQSASECGGDWWGFFGVGNRISLMIADATGHGLPSALITAAARSCFSVMAKLAQEDHAFSFSPSAMLSYANRVVFDASLGKINMTFFIAVLDLESGKLTYSNAGHNPPWFLKKNGAKWETKSLMAQGQRLGEKRDCEEYAEKTIEISRDDLLFLYTDGVIEGRNLEGEEFGKKRARKLVEASVQSGPEAVIQKLRSEFLSHNGDKPLDDDLTLAAVQILQIGATVGVSAP